MYVLNLLSEKVEMFRTIAIESPNVIIPKTNSSVLKTERRTPYDLLVSSDIFIVHFKYSVVEKL